VVNKEFIAYRDRAKSFTAVLLVNYFFRGDKFLKITGIGGGVNLYRA